MLGLPVWRVELNVHTVEIVTGGIRCVHLIFLRGRTRTVKGDIRSKPDLISAVCCPADAYACNVEARGGRNDSENAMITFLVS